MGKSSNRPSEETKPFPIKPSKLARFITLGTLTNVQTPIATGWIGGLHNATLAVWKKCLLKFVLQTPSLLLSRFYKLVFFRLTFLNN
jgi:hypothetical protein